MGLSKIELFCIGLVKETIKSKGWDDSVINTLQNVGLDLNYRDNAYDLNWNRMGFSNTAITVRFSAKMSNGQWVSSIGGSFDSNILTIGKRTHIRVIEGVHPENFKNEMFMGKIETIDLNRNGMGPGICYLWSSSGDWDKEKTAEYNKINISIDDLAKIPQGVSIEQYNNYTKTQDFINKNKYGSSDAMKRRDGILPWVTSLLTHATNWTIDALKDAFKYHNETYLKEKYATPEDLDKEATAWATWENSILKQQYVSGLGALNIAQEEVSRQIFKEQIITNAKKNNYNNSINANEKSMGDKHKDTNILYTDKYGNPSITMQDGGGQVAVSVGKDDSIKTTSTNGVNSVGNLTKAPLNKQVMKKDGNYEVYNPMNDELYYKDVDGNYIMAKSITEAVPTDHATDEQMALWQKKWKEDVEKETENNYWAKYKEEHRDLESENMVNSFLGTLDLSHNNVLDDDDIFMKQSPSNSNEEMEGQAMAEYFEILQGERTNLSLGVQTYLSGQDVL